MDIHDVYAKRVKKKDARHSACKRDTSFSGSLRIFTPTRQIVNETMQKAYEVVMNKIQNMCSMIASEYQKSKYLLGILLDKDNGLLILSRVLSIKPGVLVVPR